MGRKNKKDDYHKCSIWNVNRNVQIEKIQEKKGGNDFEKDLWFQVRVNEQSIGRKRERENRVRLCNESE